jgi:hypothetical protein
LKIDRRTADRNSRHRQDGKRDKHRSQRCHREVAMSQPTFTVMSVASSIGSVLPLNFAIASSM